jgi:hypothetical protein
MPITRTVEPPPKKAEQEAAETSETLVQPARSLSIGCKFNISKADGIFSNHSGPLNTMKAACLEEVSWFMNVGLPNAHAK